MANCEVNLKENLEISSISLAFREVITEFYVKSQILFDIIIIKSNFENFNEKIFSGIKEQNSYVLYSLRQELNLQYNVKQSAIIFVSSCNDFMAIHSTFKFNNRFQKNFKFLIYVENCETEYIESNLEYFIKTQELTFSFGTLEVFEFLLINDKAFLHLAAIEWFTKAACNKPQLKVLNSFNKTTHKWIKMLENYEKFQDFHGCNLTMGIMESDTWEESDIFFREVLYHTNLGPEVFRLISKNFNFIPSFIKLEKTNLDINAFYLFSRYIYHDTIWLHFISTFTQSRYIIVANSGSALTFSQKLLVTFDHLSWILVLVTFFAAFIAIFVINRLPEFIRKIVCGLNVQIASINVVGRVFGSTNHRTQHPPFFNILFMAFTAFCFIIRLCYQSKLLELLIDEPMSHQLDTIEDLKDHNYTLYTYLPEHYVLEFMYENNHIW
jgi:hypothetical protein